MYFEIGRIPGVAMRVVLAEAGTGNQSAAVVTDRAIGSFNPAAVIFIGVAGGLHNDLAIGDLVVGTRIYDYHEGVDSDEGFLARPRSWAGTHELLELARHVSRLGGWAQRLSVADREPKATVHFRPIAAGSVVLKSHRGAVAEQLRRSYNDAAAIETESAGVAFASHLNRASTLTIRAISDRADGAKAEADRRGWQPWAARRAAAFGVALIAEIAAGGRH
jgi:nucleoside phosphorylase